MKHQQTIQATSCETPLQHLLERLRDRRALLEPIGEGRHHAQNKDTLEAADFHQIEARLSDATGNIGFVCYRSSRTEPVRVEIEHLRSIFNRSHSTKVVLLLSEANIAQILSKRLRGKL